MKRLYIQRRKFSKLILLKGPSKMIFDKVRRVILEPLKLNDSSYFKRVLLTSRSSEVMKDSPLILLVSQMCKTGTCLQEFKLLSTLYFTFHFYSNTD